jgi:hypothetical protein
VVFKHFVERFPLLTIAPRPITGVLIAPRPIKPAPHPAQRIAQVAIVSQAVAPVTMADLDADVHDGPTQSDVLLPAIILVARKEPPSKGALRSLIAKFSSECGLGF